jgi:hypothetical protein
MNVKGVGIYSYTQVARMERSEIRVGCATRRNPSAIFVIVRPAGGGPPEARPEEAEPRALESSLETRIALRSIRATAACGTHNAVCRS